MSKLKIGTRGSPLALAQAHEVRARLQAAHPTLGQEGAIEIVVIKTTGDMIQDRPLTAIGGKGLFTKEIEEALLDGGIDLAVHSMKDVPTEQPAGLEISVILPREDPRDALFSKHGPALTDLPQGAVVGSASLRRQAQILIIRPDLKVVSIRGNVQTRLRKLAEGAVDATLLAVAGLNRLGQSDKITGYLSTDAMLPAVAQAAIGLETRIGDSATLAYVDTLNCPDSATRVRAERACLRELEGSCRTPIAALAELDQSGLRLRTLLAAPDGTAHWTDERRGRPEDAEALGTAAGKALKAQAGPDFVASLSATAAQDS
jgi:hydroxymethylbilane synthase|tara:strand:+ start:104 stop:1054 length:951 start_codon:yes stop_codon:yes gene_type:complete